jgi:signal transduction histidine kinase
LGRATPPGAKTLAALAGRTGQVARAHAGRARFWALPGAGPSGHRSVVVLAAELPWGGVMALRYEPVIGPVPLLAVLLMAGVVCVWLARPITSPVSQMRTTTQQLADGNLGARVGRAVASRHDELADLGRNVDRMAERLEPLLTAQRLLFRNVSYELRSPLARLHVALELARQSAAAEVPGYLERHHRCRQRTKGRPAGDDLYANGTNKLLPWRRWSHESRGARRPVGAGWRRAIHGPACLKPP